MPIERDQIECWHCTEPAAEDVRQWLGSCSDMDLTGQLSPMGRPPTRVAGTVTDHTD
jgi:hypothetical protein